LYSTCKLLYCIIVMFVGAILLLTITLACTVLADYGNSQKNNRRFSHHSANANNASTSNYGVLHDPVDDRHHGLSLSGYGVQLPSFAFDFSEFFSGAVIERSPTDDHPTTVTHISTDSHPQGQPSDLYLTMFLVGHSTIHKRYPFVSISTNEEVLHSWSQLIKQWTAQHRHQQLSVHHRYTRISGGKNSSIVGIPSGLFCLFRSSNDIDSNTSSAHTSPQLSHSTQQHRRSATHRTPAYWINVNKSTIAFADPLLRSAFKHEMLPVEESLVILRCRMRHSSSSISRHAVDNSAVMQRSSDVHVDIVRPHPIASKSSSADSIKLSAGALSSRVERLLQRAAESSKTSHRRHLLNYGLIISFSVPWTSRQAGYMISRTQTGRFISPHHQKSPPARVVHSTNLNAWMTSSRPEVIIIYTISLLIRCFY